MASAEFFLLLFVLFILSCACTLYACCRLQRTRLLQEQHCDIECGSPYISYSIAKSYGSDSSDDGSLVNIFD